MTKAELVAKIASEGGIIKSQAEKACVSSLQIPLEALHSCFQPLPNSPLHPNIHLWK
ncbi:MAG: hypothetical protein ABSE08_21335 [Syntrophobacteraceae bacterium]|jgi:hypothetical protein